MANIPTIQEIEKLYEQAKSGDSTALSELGELNNKLAKRANQRMTEIEKNKTISSTEAYDRAQYYLSEEGNINKGGKARFSQSRKADADTLVENLEQVTTFLRDDSSKVSAVKEQRFEESYNTLVEHNIIDELDPRSKKRFKGFLRSDAWKELKKVIGTDFIKVARDAISRGARVGDLKRLYNEYRIREDVDVFDLVDTWISGKRKFK